MITIRKAQERGSFDHGWLKTAHTFSFADYYDPEFMGFRSLRVINDDVIGPGRGFGKHPHRDMEIVTYVLSGTLNHEDSMGHSAPIRTDEVQYMSAGRGVFHSEANASADEPLHLLQIWIQPNVLRQEPRYEQKLIPPSEKTGKLKLIASGDPADEVIQIRQDAKLFASILPPNAAVKHRLPAGRYAWLQVARGELVLNGLTMKQGDGAAISEESELNISGGSTAEGGGDSEFLLFDLA